MAHVKFECENEFISRPGGISDHIQAYISKIDDSQRANYVETPVRARCAWVESDRDSRISEILIQPAGWAEASRNGKAVFSRLARPGDRGGGEGQAEPPAAGRHYEVSESVAIKWLERLERHGSREPVGHGGHRASKLMPHRDFLEAARAEKSDVTLQALCDRLSAERGVKADTSMMSRFFSRP